jgi:hypothetical protein
MELDGVGIPPETHYFSQAAHLIDDRDFPLSAEDVRRFITRYAALDVMRGVELRAESVLARLPEGVAADHESLFCAIVDALAPSDAVIIGEKTPLHIHNVGTLATRMPDLKVIGVVRDPRGRALSLHTTPWGGADPCEAAERWNRDQHLLLDAAARLTTVERMIIIRYEDAIRDPEHARRQIAQLLRIDPSPVRAVGVHELALPWETWKRRATERPDASRLDAWRTGLPTKDAEIIATITAKNLKRFGYPIGTRRASARWSGYLFVTRSRWQARERALRRRAHRVLSRRPRPSSV